MIASLRRCAAAVLCLLLAGSALANPAPPCSGGARWPRIVGYVDAIGAPPPISADKLDIVHYAFARVRPDHAVELHKPGAAATLAALTALRQDNPRLQVVLSIGGWGAGHFSEAALTAESRASFADSAVELVRQHDLDGLDIDWEYPAHPSPGISFRPEDRQNFTALLRALREALDALGAERGGRRYLLAIAAADGEAARGLEIARIAPLLDYLNLMTYDFHGNLSRTTGHHAGLYDSSLRPSDGRTAARAVDEFLDAGLPACKLHLGLAFYGRRFAEVEPAQHGLYQRFGSDGGYISWDRIKHDLLGSDGWTRHWDRRARAAWLWNARERRMVSYDDPRALRAKARFVREHGLGGVMYWEHGQDPDEELLDVVRKALRLSR